MLNLYSKPSFTVKKHFIGLILLSLLSVVACNSSVDETASASIQESTVTHTITVTPIPPTVITPVQTATIPAPTKAAITPIAADNEEQIPNVYEKITITTEDEVQINGYLFKPQENLYPEVGILLAHQAYSSHLDWNDFAELLAGQGFTALTFDFRGVSETASNPNFPSIGKDATAVAAYLRDQGFKKIICMGASLGGTGCLVAAINQNLEGLVMVSSAMNPPNGGRLVNKSDLENLVSPKLFIIAENDYIDNGYPGFIDKFISLSENMPEPKELVIMPGFDHGVALFYGSYEEEFRNLLLDFLEQYK